LSAHVQGVIQKGNYALGSSIPIHCLGFPVNQLKTAYLTFIRPISEYACPVWGPQIHNIEYLSDDVEGVQKRAMKIIRGEKFVDHRSALESFKIETLRDRMFQLIMHFGQFLLDSPKHRHFLFPC